MKVVFFILLGLGLILLILLFGLKFKVMVLLSKNQRSAYYTCFHRFFRLIDGKVMLVEDGGVSLIIKKNKLIDKDVPPEYSRCIVKAFLSMVSITKLDFYVDSGKVVDPFVSALLCGAGGTLGGIITAVAKTHNAKTEFFHSYNVMDKETAVAINLNIKLSLLKVMIAIVKARREYKNIKEKSYAN